MSFKACIMINLKKDRDTRSLNMYFFFALFNLFFQFQFLKKKTIQIM
jgi:hypothetical protein